MLGKFYEMLQKSDLKSFKLKVGMVNAKSGAPIAEGTVVGEASKPAPQEIFESTVQNVP